MACGARGIATKRPEGGIREGDRQSGAVAEPACGLPQDHASAGQFREPRRSSTASRRWRAPAASFKVRATVKGFGELEVSAPSGPVASRTLVFNRGRAPHEAPLDRLPGYKPKAQGIRNSIPAISPRAVAHEGMATLPQLLVQHVQHEVRQQRQRGPLDSSFAPAGWIENFHRQATDHARHTTRKPRTSRDFRSSCEVISGGACDDAAHEAVPDDRPLAVPGLSARPTR
jgi:hypothetical protein